MPSTIATFTGTNTPTGYNSQRRLDRCRNGVRWAMLLATTNSRLVFYFSTDNGATWTEDVSQRLENVHTTAGASMRIITRGDGEERLVCVYRDSGDDHIKTSFGIFARNRQSFNWHTEDKRVNSGGGTGINRGYPELDGYYQAPQWIVAYTWDRLDDGKAHFNFNRVRWQGSDSFALDDIELHSAVSSVHARGSLGIRHLGDDETVDQSAPDLYVGYNLASAGGFAGGRVYMRRMPASGQTWESGDPRRVQNAAGISGGRIASCYTGARFATAWVPENATDTIMLGLMTPQDSVEPTVLEAPDLADGQITNLGVTWDNASSSVYIVASGATSDNLSYVIYDWSTREFGSWVNVVTSENLEADTLSVKPGSRGSQIECVYAIVSGSDRQVRYQLVAATNVPPTVVWVTTSGAYNASAALVPTWDYSDADGDAQAQYTLRRYVNDSETPSYWNGTAWQATLVDISSAAESVSLSSGWATSGDTVRYQVRVSDGQVFSPWSDTLTVLAATVVTPTITALTTITTPRVEVAWTVSQQSAYRVRLLDAAGTVVIHDSDWLPGASVRDYEVPVDLANGTSYTQAVRTQNNVGLSSAEVTDVFAASLTPPSTPTLVLHDNPAAGAIDVVVTNPGAGVAVVRNQIIREDLVGGDVIVPWGGSDIANNGTFVDRTVAHGGSYGYTVRAFTSVGAHADSAQVTVLT